MLPSLQGLLASTELLLFCLFSHDSNFGQLTYPQPTLHYSKCSTFSLPNPFLQAIVIIAIN